ncbi:MAG: hypothetical protein QXT86_08975 [Archaeoglobaceae archaeon]
MPVKFEEIFRPVPQDFSKVVDINQYYLRTGQSYTLRPGETAYVYVYVDQKEGSSPYLLKHDVHLNFGSHMWFFSYACYEIYINIFDYNSIVGNRIELVIDGKENKYSFETIRKTVTYTRSNNRTTTSIDVSSSDALSFFVSSSFWTKSILYVDFGYGFRAHGFCVQSSPTTDPTFYEFFSYCNGCYIDTQFGDSFGFFRWLSDQPYVYFEVFITRII